MQKTSLKISKMAKSNQYLVKFSDGSEMILSGTPSKIKTMYQGIKSINRLKTLNRYSIPGGYVDAENISDARKMVKKNYSRSHIKPSDVKLLYRNYTEIIPKNHK